MSSQFISKIENLETLLFLRTLNLSENNLKNIENLNCLVNLESLNLTGNLIVEIPKTQIEDLQNLRSLRISKNKISNLREFANLALLSRLDSLWAENNPAAQDKDYSLFLAYSLSTLQSLDGSPLSHSTRQKANRQYGGPPAEIWATRENLVSFRRKLSEFQESRRENSEQLQGKQYKLERISSEISQINTQLEKAKLETENIGNALDSSPDFQVRGKTLKMKALIDKAEELKEASIHAQNSIAGLRQSLHKKENHLKFLQKQLSDHSLVETHTFLYDEEAQAILEIEELTGSIDRVELEYDELFSRLRESTNEITSLEEEIVSLRGSLSESTPRWKQEGSRYSKEYLLDSDTKQVLIQRLTDLEEHIPDLHRKKATLLQQRGRLEEAARTLENTITNAGNHIANLQENIASSEQYLSKHATSSPMRGPSNLNKMWNSLKSLWGLVNDSPWDGECEDIPKAVISWCAHMKGVLTQRKLDHNRLSEQQQVTISQLQESLKNSVPKKEFNIQRMKLEAISLEESNAKKLNSELKKELNELKILLEKTNETQIADDTESGTQFKELIGNRIETAREEQKLQNQLAKLRGYCEHKADQLQSLNEDFEYKNSAVESLTGRLEDLVALEKEIETKLDMESKENIGNPARHPTSRKAPLTSANAFYCNSLVKVAGCLDIDASEFTENQLTEEIVSAAEALHKNMQKVKRFEKNKEKFVEMYEQKSEELQDTWEQLRQERYEQDLTRNKLQSLKTSKEVLEKEVNTLNYLKTDLSHTNSSLEKEKIKLEEQIYSLKESTTTYKHLKERETREYNRSHQLYTEETDNYEALLKELKQLQSQLKQLHEERIDFEVTRDQLKAQTTKLEEKKKSLEQEIEGYDEMITKLSHKLTAQQREVYSELDSAKNSINDKKIELDQLQGILHTQNAKISQREDTLKSLSNQVQKETEEQDNMRKEIKQVAQELQQAESKGKQVHQDIESSDKTLAHKAKKLKELDASIHSRTSQLENTEVAHRDSLSELQGIEARLNQLKSEESSLQSVHSTKQSEILALNTRTTEKKHELKQLDTLLKEKSQKLAYTEKRLKDSKQLISLEEENYVKLKDESSYILNRIACLKDNLHTIEAQKTQFLSEIDEMHKKRNTDENRHRQDVEKLRIAVSNGETTFRQLMEAVQKCRNKISHDKEEAALLTAEINSLQLSRENTHSEISHLKSELEYLLNRAANYKIEEDSAMVLLAISGQKSAEHIKKRVTEIVKSAIELESVKEKLLEAEKELEVRRQHTRMQNTMIYSPHRLPEHIESGASSVDFSKLLPETEEIRDLLKNLECSQQRLKSLTPVPQEDP